MGLLQEKIAHYLKERGWDNAPPGDYVKSISIEAAELLEHFQWHDFSSQDIRNNHELLKKIGTEIADVLIYAIDTCVILDIDFEELVLSKLTYNAKKYPVKLVKNNSENYYKIKENYRKR